MTTKKVMLSIFLGLIVVVGIITGVSIWSKNKERKNDWSEKKVTGFIKEIDNDRLLVDDGIYIYAFNNLDKSQILLVNRAMQAEKADWEILKKYQGLEQKIEVNYAFNNQQTKILEVIIPLYKAWNGELEMINQENKTISIRGDNKTLVFANNKQKGADLQPGDEVTIWVNYDRAVEKFIIDEIKLNN